MGAELSLDSNAIEDLAGQINEAISGVMNVETILAETADDVMKAGDLKARAEQVMFQETKGCICIVWFFPALAAATYLIMFIHLVWSPI